MSQLLHEGANYIDWQSRGKDVITWISRKLSI